MCNNTCLYIYIAIHVLTQFILKGPFSPDRTVSNIDSINDCRTDAIAIMQTTSNNRNNF